MIYFNIHQFYIGILILFFFFAIFCVFSQPALRVLLWLFLGSLLKLYYSFFCFFCSVRHQTHASVYAVAYAYVSVMIDTNPAGFNKSILI